MQILLFFIFLPILIAGLISESENAESETKKLLANAGRKETVNRGFDLKGFLLKNFKKMRIGSIKRKMTKNIRKKTNKILRLKSQQKRIMSDQSFGANKQINALIDEKFAKLRWELENWRTTFERCGEEKNEKCLKSGRKQFNLAEKVIENLEKERKKLKNEQDFEDFYDKLENSSIQILTTEFEEAMEKENGGTEIEKKKEDN